ncbi:hypothetical protein D3C79_900200 [compost metagenome]
MRDRYIITIATAKPCVSITVNKSEEIRRLRKGTMEIAIATQTGMRSLERSFTSLSRSPTSAA